MSFESANSRSEAGATMNSGIAAPPREQEQRVHGAQIGRKARVSVAFKRI
jgi:hypothetical protein